MECRCRLQTGSLHWEVNLKLAEQHICGGSWNYVIALKARLVVEGTSRVLRSAPLISSIATLMPSLISGQYE